MTGQTTGQPGYFARTVPYMFMTKRYIHSGIAGNKTEQFLYSIFKQEGTSIETLVSLFREVKSNSREVSSPKHLLT